MRVLLIMTITLLMSARCMAQVDTTSATFEKLNKKIEDLKNRKTSFIISHYRSCIGGMVRMHPRDSCIAFDRKYLFWADNEHFYMQRFDECKTYDSCQVSPIFLNFIKANYLKIKTADLRTPTFKSKNSRHSKYSLLIDHTCYDIYHVFSGRDDYVKKLNEFFLETEYFEKQRNINYTANQKSILNLLYLLLPR